MREVWAPLQPTVVAILEAEPGWAWMRCEVCAEVRYYRRSKPTMKCSMTPKCPGVMKVYLGLDCFFCGKSVTARRRDLDIRFCSKKCEMAWPPEEAA